MKRYALAVALALAGILALPAAEEAFDAELKTFPYPHPVKFRGFQAQGQTLTMAYMDVPAPQPNGQTVVLLHGKNFSGAYWGPTIDALRAAGFRVVVPDQVGFGKSTKPAHFQYSFHALAAQTKALLDELGVTDCIVAGHSMGGMLAVRFALLYPGTAKRLVLINPIGLEDWKTRVPYRGIDELYAQELKATPDTLREYQRQNYFAGQWKPEYEPLIRAAAGWTRGPDRQRIAWNSALTTDMIWTQPVLYEFPLLRQPTLLIIGQRDRTALGKAWAPREVAEMLGDYVVLGERAASTIPQAKLVRIDNAGHLPQVEAFEEYLTALLAYIGR